MRWRGSVASGIFHRHSLVELVLGGLGEFVPQLGDAVVVGDVAFQRQPGIRRHGRADAAQTNADARRLIRPGGQIQPDRLAAMDAVGVEQREQQRLRFVEPIDRVGEMAAIGFAVELDRGQRNGLVGR